MKTPPAPPTALANRRRFLRRAVTGAGVATAAAAVPHTMSAAPATETPPPKEGYRLSQHIIDYYKTAAG